MISPIHKSQDTSKPEFLSQRLKLWCERNNAIGEEQAGFHSDYSTTDNLFCLQTIEQKYLRRKGGRLYAYFVDFENHVIRYCEKVYERSGKNLFWSIKNSGEVLNKLKSRGFRATSLSTYDFSTL